MVSIAIDLSAFTLTSDAKGVNAAPPETRLIITRPDLNLGKIPDDGMNFGLQVTYAQTNLPPSIVRLPYGMRERRNRTLVINSKSDGTPTTVTATIMVHVEKYARSGELWVTTGSGPGWMEKTSSGWIDVMP